MSLKSPVTLPPGKSKTTYALLAIFLGAYGVHNYWAGNQEKAKSQLIYGLLGFPTCGITSIISWVTALQDISAVGKA